ncbi:hypothetical protein KUTeg_024152, partial [Tegillarca granosa]
MAIFTTISLVRRNWFLCGILFVILMAKFYPEIGSKGGILKPEITVKIFAVSIIFFNSGISLRTEDLTKALLQIKVHLFIQCFTFILFPMAMMILVALLETGPFDKLILEGLKVLGCMPPPVSSAAAAIFNSAFGSFMGIFVTPALILYVVGTSASVLISSIFMQLSATVVLPLILGQIIRKYTKVWLERKHIPFGSIGSAILLLIIYTTFCDTFSHGDIEIDELSLISVTFIIVVVQIFLLLLIFYISTQKKFGYSPPDIIALMYCSTHKSLTLGIPKYFMVYSRVIGIIANLLQ